MPIDYAVDDVLRIVRVTATGIVDPDQELTLLERILADPRRRPGFGWLCDFRERSPAASAEHVRDVARVFLEHRAALGPSRMAALISRDVGHGLARMFDALVDDALEVAIFRDLAEAEAWLGAPPRGTANRP